jgi:hypothetical protein
VLYAVYSYRRSVEVVRGLIADALEAGVEPVVFQEDPLMLDENKAVFAEYAKDDFCFPGSTDLYDDAGFTVVSGVCHLKGKVEKALEQLSAEDSETKILVIDERGAPRKAVLDRYDSSALLVVPQPMQSLEPLRCPYCQCKLFAYQHSSGQIMYRCFRRGRHRAQNKPREFQVSATIKIYDGGVKKAATDKTIQRRLWTQAESEQAIGLRKQGLSYPAIGKVLGRSKHSVKSHLSGGGHEGIKKRQATRAYLRERMAAMADLAI